jgi:hypothetical protein
MIARSPASLTPSGVQGSHGVAQWKTQSTSKDKGDTVMGGGDAGVRCELDRYG